MKNNEIMISARFEGENFSDEVSFLILKDISLKSSIESLYYGSNKSNDHEKHFEILEEYLKTRKEVQVKYYIAQKASLRSLILLKRTY